VGIKVIAATYGTNNKGNDVTEICQAVVDRGNDYIGVNNETLRGDPDPGATKFFGIIYTLPNGATRARGGVEDDTIALMQ
jgi:hypothetical protein